MDDFNFDASDTNVYGDISSESTLEPEPPVEIPDETQSNPESTIEIESEHEQSVVVPDDIQSATVSVSDNAKETISEPEPSVVVPEATDSDASSKQDEQVTIHPYRPTVEVPPSPDLTPDREPISTNPNIEKPDSSDEGAKPIPPEGWTPGGPEQG